MLGFTSLLAPLLLGGALLLGVAVSDVKTIYIREMVIPSSLSDAGYTAEVVERRINDNILAIERQASTRPESRRLATDADRSPLELLADYLNVELLVRAIQDAGGLIEYSIAGSVVVEGRQNVMRLDIRHSQGQRSVVTITRPAAEIPELLMDAASAILRVTDPQIVCASLLRQGLLVDPPNFDDAQSCILGSLPVAANDDRIWLYNLAGVIAFLRGDQAGAVRGFRAALRLDREFSPAMLNLGILFADNGRHRDAIRAFRAVFDQETMGESPQTYAAAYTEWGNSLVAMGRHDEALARFADAVRTDHRYAPAYFSWANALAPGDQQDNLRRYGRIVATYHDQHYTENLVGRIRNARVRAAAR